MNARRVAGKPLAAHIVHVQDQIQPLVHRLDRIDTDNIFQQMIKPERHLLDFNAAGLDFRNVEQVIDQHQQAFA